jgi:L-threonylcarbamoyladenylate synthase
MDDHVANQALLTTDPARAVEALLAGGLVALPTETVYGLGADAGRPHAVARVFAVKGRPADHPLIVHIRGAEDLAAWARDIPPYARALAEALWPGPLTLVLPRSARAGDHVTGGQDTVGLRAPSHPAARAVLAALGGRGIAAPSANRFGRVSPTTAQHVLDELGALLDPATDLVLDGGACDVGVESTILDCTGERPRLLRPGAVDADTVAIAGGVPLDPEGVSSVRAPGTLASHYAPSARVTVAGENGLGEALALAAAGGPGPVGLLAAAAVATPVGVVRLSEPADDAAYAQVLYSALREADALGLAAVVAVPPDEGPLAAAVADRLRRAAHHP